jgi:hypothetical protein
LSGEPTQDETEERMPVRRLRERARTRHQTPIDEADERPQRKVLAGRQRECKPALIDIDSLPHGVERDAEQRTVRSVYQESD